MRTLIHAEHAINYFIFLQIYKDQSTFFAFIIYIQVFRANLARFYDIFLIQLQMYAKTQIYLIESRLTFIALK